MHHIGCFPWFGFPFFLFFIAVLIITMIMRRRNRFCYRESFSTLELLEKRYINGEIDEVEFKKSERI
ncbi:hypothetical protein NG54_14820 [Heyndrickxia ginsengihumi]|uniref:SHOCT domain-containing protein n=1 Tax=Heyndrickxia ginsengihumi TaxID=363870 RepID=A0A0A6V8Y6_9BACI|nr:hypothetical protein [Heyndrickxia ginsengihumi]KHD84540.1 hypothetical protein NG54_14820 [Heyndrickxia ginsengihumi]